MHIIIIQNNDLATKSLIKAEKNHVAQIKKILPSATITIVEQEKINTVIEKATVLICQTVANIDYSKAKNLQWVHVTSAGVNTLPQELLQSNILITNSSGVHPVPIAEHIFAFILMFARQIIYSYRIQIEDKTWTRSSLLLPTFELNGKIIAIIGMGRIGKEVARLAKSFNMNIIGINSKNQNTLVTALKKSDFIINILPSTQETQGLFDLEKFKTMKKSAYFINVGRGTTVVEKDLITALKQNVIAGAGLDVFEKEPLSDTSALWKLPNVIITPHYAGWTPFYMDRVIDIFCVNLQAFLSHKKMPNLIDKSKGY